MLLNHPTMLFAFDRIVRYLVGRRDLLEVVTEAIAGDQRIDQLAGVVFVVLTVAFGDRRFLAVLIVVELFAHFLIHCRT